MIELNNVCSGYDGLEVLHHIDMKFEPGKVTALIGPNGCGKSTLLKAIVRIHPHTSGCILADGKRTETYQTKEFAKKVAYLPQSRPVSELSVLKMVLHGRFAYLGYPRKYREEDIRIARHALEWAGLTHLEEEKVSHLSGGMQQAVYLAMAVAQNADTILMDEPTAYLDAAHQLKVLDMARQMAREGKAVVLVLHDLSQALRTADYVYVLKEGCIAVEGTPEAVYESGKLQEIFQVKVEQIKTESGTHYVSVL